MIRLNWKAIGILLVTLLALGAGSVALYRYQRERTTARFLADARAAETRGDREAAISSYQMYLERRPGDAAAMAALARVLDARYAAGQASRADVLTSYRRLLELQPGDRAARRRLVELLVDRRPRDSVFETFQNFRLADAEEVLKNVTILDPGASGTPPAEAAGLLEARGLAELRLGRFPAARLSFQEALKLDAGRVLGASILASLLVDPSQPPTDPPGAGRVLDAMVAANEASPGNPRLASAYLERAVYRKLMEQASWREDLDRARKLDPKGIAPLLKAGQFAGIDGRLDEARALLKEAVAVDPKDPRAYQQIAAIEVRAERPEEAADWLRRGLETLKEAKLADPNLSWFYATVLADNVRTDRGQKSQEAKSALQEYRKLPLEYESKEGRLVRQAETRFVEAIIRLGEAKSPQENAAVAALLAGIDAPLLARNEQSRLDGMYYMTLATAHTRSIDRNGTPEEARRARNKAIEALRRAAAAMPTDARPLLALATLLGGGPLEPGLDDRGREAAAAERLEAAVEVLESGLAQFPPVPKDDATRAELGRVLGALIQLRLAEQARRPAGQRSWAAVERLLARGRAACPTSPAFNEMALRYYGATGNLATATAQLQARVAEAKDAATPELRAALAQSWIAQNRPDEAIKVLDEAAAKVGDQVVLRLARAGAEQARGDTDAALTALTANLDAIATDERPRLWQQVARIQLARRDYDAARRAIGRWAELRPLQVEPHAELFRIAIGLRDEATARAELAQIEKLDGRDGFQTRCSRVDVALNFDKPEQIAAEVQAFLKAYPDRMESHLANALYLEEKADDAPKAIAAYKVAMDLSPTPEVIGRLAALYAKSGKLEELSALQQQMGDSAAVARISVGALASAGRKDRAAELAAQLAQGNPEALNLQLWQADVLRNLGNPEEAAAKLRKLTQDNPQQLEPWASLLMLQVAQKQLPEAAATLEAMKKAVKVERPELVWGRCAVAMGDRAAADREYKAALARWPDDPLVVQTVLAYYRQTGRDDEAAAILRGVRERKPDARWAVNQLADVLAGRAATWPEALALVEPPPPPDQETSLDRLVRANVRSRGPRLEDKEQAIALLKGLADDPTNSRTTETRLLLGELYRELGRTAESFEQARLASTNSTSIPALVFLIGRALENNQLAEARQALARLETADPDSLRTAVLRARILLKEQKAPEGVATLKTALASLSASEADPGSLLDAPPLLFQLGDAAAAAAAVEQVAKLRPDIAWGMIPALVAANRVDEAFALAERAIGTEQSAGAAGLLLQSMLRRPLDDPTVTRLDGLLAAALKPNPNLANLLIGQATIRHYQGRFAEEVAIYERVLKDDPSRSDFLNNLAWTLSESLNRPDDALKYVDRALAKMPGEPSIADTKGVILMRLKQNAKAIQVLTAAAQDARLRSPQVYPVVMYHLARAYHADGQSAAAQQTLTLARRAGFQVETLTLEEQKEARAFVEQVERPAAAAAARR